MTTARWRVACPTLLLSVMGCTSSEARPQLVIAVDTDAPVAGQLDEVGVFSADAAVDTLLVNVFGRGPEETDLVRTFTLPEAASWPVSFGVEPVTGGEPLLIRLRAFRAALANRDAIGEASGEPRQEVTIDRIVEVGFPHEGVVTASVRLSLACVGRRASLIDERTCVEANQVEGGFRSSVTKTDGEISPSSAVGTSPLALSTPCAGPGREGAICVPGGFTYLGSYDAAGGETWASGGADPSPMRPVHVAPFFMDEREFTVGRLRPLVATHPELEVPTPEGCSEFGTWSTDGANDDKPVNCITWDSARLACQLEGGDLPTESQWEHAARGRRGYLYPWGNAFAECCSASLSRTAETGFECGGPGAEPTGSHLDAEQCNGTADRTVDGVVDLAGNVSELQRDDLVAYDEGCWLEPGIFADGFVCLGNGAHAVRGGSWADGLANALAPLRKVHWRNALQGFRCVYEDQQE